MFDKAGGIINIVIAYQDALRQMILEFLESAEFTGVGFVILDAIGDLNIIFAIAFLCKKVDLPAMIVIGIQLVIHVQQLVINDILKIVVQIISVVHATNGIQGDIPVIALFVKSQFLLGSS